MDIIVISINTLININDDMQTSYQFDINIYIFSCIYANKGNITRYVLLHEIVKIFQNYECYYMLHMNMCFIIHRCVCICELNEPYLGETYRTIEGKIQCHLFEEVIFKTILCYFYYTLEYLLHIHISSWRI